MAPGALWHIYPGPILKRRDHGDGENRGGIMLNEQPSTAYAQVNRKKSRNRHQNFVVPEGIRRDVLAKTDGFQITYYEQSRDSDKVLVTFDGIGSDISDSGFGTKFALAHGYNHVFVAQRIRSQYQELSIEQFYDAVHNLIGSREVFTYGSSLGGYCALYYGGCIDATIVAAAPKNSALPEFLKPEFEDLEFRHLPLSQVPKSSKDPVILYDPFRKVDDKMVKQFVLPIYPNARIVELPFAGHNVLTPMKAGVLKQFMLDVFDHGIVPQPSGLIPADVSRVGAC